MALLAIYRNRTSEFWILTFLSLLCIGLSAFRVYWSGTKLFLFLNWNLFLAALPWLFTSLLLCNKRLQRRPLILSGLLLSWLFFFPNAPYILTDLFHLRYRTEIPIWYDMTLILAFAWTGLLFGFLSLWDIEQLLSERIPKKAVVSISVLLLFLSAFGIYLGRYLRWNTWDLVNEPGTLMQDVIVRLLHPFQHPQTWGMTLTLGAFLTMLYFSFRFMKVRREV